MKRTSVAIAIALALSTMVIAAPGAARDVPVEDLLPEPVQETSGDCELRWIEAVGGGYYNDDELIGVSACDPGPEQKAKWTIDNYSWHGSCKTGLGDDCSDTEAHDVQKCSYVHAWFENTGESDLQKVGDECGSEDGGSGGSGSRGGSGSGGSTCSGCRGETTAK